MHDVTEIVAAVDRGEIRVAERTDGTWRVNHWVQEAIVAYFGVTTMSTTMSGPFEYHDRIPLKRDLAARGIRAVPGSIVRYGCHVERGAVLMPCFVNIGAFVGSETMVDTWATVGSGAQVGRRVHLAGGVGIGGVLEPPGARPVIIEDEVFVGSRCSIVEGVIVEQRAVIAAQVALTASTPIIDMTGDEPVIYKGRVPAGAVVVPGTRAKAFPAGTVQIACAYIVGYREDRHDAKLALMELARAF